MNRKNIIILILCILYLPIYMIHWAYKGPIVINEVKVVSAYCQPTLKSGTFFKAAYIFEGEKKTLTTLSLGIACEDILTYLKVNDKMFLRQEINIYGNPVNTEVSINGGRKYYGRK